MVIAITPNARYRQTARRSPVAVAPENLALALQQLERISGDQLRTIEAASTKTSVALGFVLATLVTVVGLGRPAFASHALAASGAVACLAVSAVLLIHSYRITFYGFSPEPRSLLGSLGLPPAELRRALVAGLAAVVEENHAIGAARLRWLNWGMGLALVGAIIYAVGVGLT